MHVGIHMWQSEDSLEELVPPAVCTPRDQTQNIGWGLAVGAFIGSAISPALTYFFQ